MDDRGAPLQILLVDDNEDDYLIVRDLFRDVGMERFKLDWAPTYEEGLAKMLAKQHDLVLVDYRLDARNGLDLLEEANQRGHKAPFILMTGQGDHDIDVKAMQAGVADYLVKDQLNGPLLERVVRYAIDRSRSAEALRQSENRFRALIENSAEAIFLSRSDGSIIYTSASTQRILGYDAPEILGLTIQDIVHPDDHIRVCKMFADLQEHPGVAIMSTHRVRHQDGSWRWVESVNTNWLHDPAVEAIVSNYRDVTERVNTENELRHSEARYRTLFKTNPHPSWVYSRETLAFLAVNQAAIKHYGYTREEFLSMTLKDIRPPEDIPEFVNYMATIVRSGQNTENRRHRKKDGSIIQVELTANELSFDGHPARLVVVTDITERMQAEQALRESEQRFDIVTRATNDAVWDLDLTTDCIWWNQGFHTLFGYDPQERESATARWAERIHPDDVLRVTTGFDTLIGSSQKTWSDEYRFRRANGSYAFIFDRAYVIRDEQGQPVRMIGSMLDITSRKSAESAIRQSEERYRSLVRASSQIVWTANADGSEIISSDWSEFTAQPSGELQNMGWLAVVHPEDRDRVAAAWAKSVETKSLYCVEYRILKQDGTYAPVATRGVPILEASGRIREWVGMTTNISERKMAEEELEKSLALLQATLESTADSILVLDEEGKVADFNGKFVRMWGIPDEMLLPGQKHRILACAQEQLAEPELFLGQMESGLDDKDYDLLQFKDGRIIERYSQPQSLGGKKLGRVWSFRDVSGRKWAEAVQLQLTTQLQQERQRLDDILANVPGVVWEHYLHGGEDEPIPDYVSDYVKVMLGYTPDEWLKGPEFWKELLHPDDRTSTLERSAAIVRGGRSDCLQYRMKTKDGTFIWVETYCAPLLDDSGRVIGIRGVSMDITDRRQAQEEQARLAALLENTTDFVGWADTEGHAQYVNRAGRLLLGIEEEDIPKMPIAAMSPQWAFELIESKGLPAALEKGVWVGQTALLNRDGQEIPVSQVIIAHKNERGEAQFFSTIARDVSQQKKVEAALQKANDELELRVMERTAELEQAIQELLIAKEEADAANHAKSDFLSRMSHELRTPLNAILGFGQILEMRDLGPKETEGVAQILKAGRHLLALINEVLDIARIEANRLSLSPEPIEVAHSLRESLDLVRPLATARQVQLVNLVEQDEARLQDWHIRADRQRFYQVLLNLLSNAIKYNREGGTVTLLAEVIDSAPGETNARLRIEVRDTGFGLTPENQRRLFVPFERLGAECSKVEGTGIGLALAKRLTEAMEGKIGVISTVGEGSVFWVEMPLVEGTINRLQRLEPQLSSVKAIQEMAASLQSATILYIEDNVSNLKIIERILSDLPQLRLLTAMQGEIGLEFALDHQPDLILLDLHLPDMMGDEVLTRLKASPLTRDIPVVMISADGTEKQIDKLLAAGAKDYLTKPLEIGQLLRVLDESLRSES